MKIFKEVAIYIGASFAQKILPLVLLPILTRILTPSEYGVLAMFTIAITTFSLMLGNGLNGFVRMVYHKVPRVNFRHYVENVLFLFLWLTFLSFLILIYFESELSEIFKIDKNYLFLAFAVAFSRFIID